MKLLLINDKVEFFRVLSVILYYFICNLLLFFQKGRYAELVVFHS